MHMDANLYALMLVSRQILCYTSRHKLKWRIGRHMAGGIWDSNLKQLVAAHPQHFVTWPMPGAQIISELSGHLNRPIDTDTMYEVVRDALHGGFHMEVQRYRDTEMAQRVWEYNVLATCKYGYAFESFVLYLKDDGKVAESPFIKYSLSGREIHRFFFENTKLWEVPTEELRQLNLVGLSPLLPLTREGGKPEVVEEVISQVETIGSTTTKKNLLSITMTLASLALESKNDKQWLIRRFKMYQDILKDSYIYQLIAQDGVEQGMQQGIEMERQQELQDLRNLVLGFVQSRFAALLPLASTTVAEITSKELLSQLVLDVGLAKTEDEARQALMAAQAR